MAKNDNDSNSNESTVPEQKLDSGQSQQGDSRGKAENLNPVQDLDKSRLNDEENDFADLKESTAALPNQPLDSTPAGEALGHNPVHAESDSK